ncbi:Hypothetical protein R9X50_00489400 [Acrodontium crateriforme]|uniref:HSF-type DNA-binding domain-containing protein n=1 Tax=Acrodontium crateriforme TaxID=150365 RepID=A0AAQ3R8Q8_9PEZI|nr:Hypothetical protein R9X50_00489400 [Acrodontium crateriforme]
MATLEHPVSRGQFASGNQDYGAGTSRTVPIRNSDTTPTTTADDPMDVVQPQTGLMGPPTNSPNPNGERATETRSTPTPTPSDQQQQPPANGASHPIGAAAAAQQPKVVQTAFIHKLYNMLEDRSIAHLISWANTNESFVMSPSTEFSKVLAQYFKHTNISSFVRQLNMYGFHKVSDVFHTGSPDSPLWEFKHGAGNFKRGDLAGLREIKRRASRHTLMHRDSFSTNSTVPPLPPQTGGAPVEPMPDPIEARLNYMEWSTQDFAARLSRSEDAYAAMSSKCQTILEGLSKSHRWNHELSGHLLTLVPDPTNPVHREVYAMRQDIMRQMEQLRAAEESNPTPLLNSKPSFYQNSGIPAEPAMPISPRQRPYDESRRPSLQMTSSRPSSFRAPVPPHLQVSPRRFGSISAGSYSPTSSRANLPPPPPPPPQPTQVTQPPQPHPLSNMTSPPSGLGRRHTSADIRLHGWQGDQPPPPQYNHGSSPYASGQSSTAWPSSPRAAGNPGDQQLQDALAQYELPARASHTASRQPSPPAPHDSGAPTFSNSFGSSYANSNDAGWQLPGPRYPVRGLDTPGPPTRRSSMASNVHSLLNPADTAEREGEDEGPDDRKRKRML